MTAGLAHDRASDLSPQAQATRARIVETAERLFRAMGYAKTAVADIARELKMSPANVYRFFPSKAAINEAIAERLLAGVEQRAAGIVHADAPAAQRLDALFRAMFEETRSRYLGEAKVHDMVTAAMEEQWAVIQAHIDRIRGLVATLVADGIARGEFVIDDLEGATRGTHMMLSLFCHPQVVCQCLMSDGDRQLDHSVRLVLGALTRRGI